MTGAFYPGPDAYPGPGIYPAANQPAPVPAPVINPWQPQQGFRVWTAVSRNADYTPGVILPIVSLQGVRRHMGIGTAALATTYSPERWSGLGPGNGLSLYRDGRQEWTGLVKARQMDWDRHSGERTIKVEAVGDEQGLADRIVFPDPLRVSDDQTVNDYWMTRDVDGNPVAAVASTAMRQLISDQAGPTCRPARQIQRLVMGSDPGIGTSRTWTGLFDNVLTLLTQVSISSRANLGIRMTAAGGQLIADVVAPRNLASTIKFSADLSNLVGFSYREEAPTVTNALAAGQGDLHTRLRHSETTTDNLAGAWGRQIWQYVDRRDTADATELAAAATDALAQGASKVSLTVNLTDSQAATYGRDWALGDLVTVYVGLPGQEKVTTVVDVVREISFTVNAKGAEVIQPAIGTYDASALIPTPTQAQLALVGASLSGLITRK